MNNSKNMPARGWSPPEADKTASGGKKIIIIIVSFLFLPFLVNAQTEHDCVFGLVNDPAPGACVRYVDDDANDLCDLSEVPVQSSYQVDGNKQVASLSEDELKQKTVKEVAEVYGIETGAYRTALSEFLKIDVKGGDSLSVLHDDNGLCSGVAANIALDIKNSQGSEGLIEHGLTANTALTTVDSSKKVVRYKLLPITVTLIILYLITYVLVLQKKMKVLTLRRIWNVVLLLASLASILLALLLIIRVNLGFVLPLPFDMLYWHVETGTVMMIVTLFHLSWHWRFYTCMLKRRRKEECDSKQC